MLGLIPAWHDHTGNIGRAHPMGVSMPSPTAISTLSSSPTHTTGESSQTSTRTHLSSITPPRPSHPGQQSTPTGSHNISAASVAGIVVGLMAGFLIIALAGMILYRRKRQNKPIHGLQRCGLECSTFSGPYPPVACPYDPDMLSGRLGTSSSGSSFNFVTPVDMYPAKPWPYAELP